MEKLPEIIKQSEEKKENQEIKGGVKFVLYDREYELETYSYDFEYPESIQKETGIMGYKRTIIKPENIFNLIYKSYLDNFEFDIKKEGCEDWQIEEFFRKKIDEIAKKFGKTDSGWPEHYENGQYANDIYRTEYFEKFREYMDTSKEGKILSSLVDTNENLYPKIIENLSMGEFPKRTFNHSMGIHQEGEHEKEFVKDKFFIQKLFDIDLTKKIKLGDRATSVDSTEPIIMNIFDKSNGESIGEIDTNSLSKYEDKIKNNQVFLIGYDAFNTCTGRFWGYGYSSNINFGFSLNDNFFEEYIKKAYEIFLKNNFDTKKELIGIEQIIRMIAFCDNDFFEGYKRLYKKEGNKEISEKEDRDEKEKLNQIFNGIRERFLPNINQEETILNKKIMFVNNSYGLGSHNGNEDFVKKIKNIMDRNYDGINRSHITEDFLRLSTEENFTGYPGDKSDEICIPIFINHDEVLQICWGHAKYASFINKKGFNFFEFKHADHLPNKTD
jgi:hypothetical protein